VNSNFKSKIDNRDYTVGVVGLGYVGLPLIREFVKKDFKSIGFDIDESKIKLLDSGKTYIDHISEESISEMVNSGKFSATNDFSKIRDVDAIIICVPTPLTLHREPDLSYITSTAESFYKYMKEGQLVTLESTTYPGTTDEILLPILEKSGLKAGKEFYLAFSPEREDPGNKSFNTSTIPKVVGGFCQESSERAGYLYEQVIVKTVAVPSTATAEAVKILENIFRSVNIALINELKVIYSEMGIDIWDVVEAAKTKPFGYMPFYPGPGLGGHCIPIDPFYLTWKAREFGHSTKFIELAGEINTAMPLYVINRLMNALNDHGKSMKNSKILVLGLSYKKDIDDIRESPSLKLLEILKAKGAKIAYHDPYVPKMKKTREYKDLEGLNSVELTPESIKEYDAVLISTAHSSINYNEIVKNAKLVVDTRNATKDVTENREIIVKA
jgi:UDP-N-acetyl-D-glucosamine dehydrogenase